MKKLLRILALSLVVPLVYVGLFIVAVLLIPALLRNEEAIPL